MFGFSAGGFTAMVMIGGVPDMTRVAPYCTQHPGEWACRKLHGTYAPPPPDAFVHDPASPQSRRPPSAIPSRRRSWLTSNADVPSIGAWAMTVPS
jgi:hypothetical protein